MANVVVEYGPPGHKGVQSIMGIGSADLEMTDTQTDMAKVGGGAVALWLVGSLSGVDAFKQIGLGAGLAVVALQYLAHRRRDPAASVTLPF